MALLAARNSNHVNTVVTKVHFNKPSSVLRVTHKFTRFWNSFVYDIFGWQNVGKIVSPHIKRFASKESQFWK